MYKFVILLSVFASNARGEHPPQVTGRIVGGTIASISDFPWQVSLQHGGVHVCGGTIYSDRVVLTAAHCLQSVVLTALRVRVGSNYWAQNGILRSIASYKLHEDYNPNTMENDIALMHLAAIIAFNANARPIALATTQPASGASAVVTGWGTTWYGGYISAELQFANVSIVSQEKCGSQTYAYGKAIKDTMVCAYTTHKDACQYDSGGPLVSAGVLVGIVSWGVGCATPSYPGVYADVAALADWVRNNA